MITNLYIPVGGNKNLRREEILGIFDLDHATASRVTQRFLSRAEKRGEVEMLSEELPKSFLVTAPPMKAFPSAKEKTAESSSGCENSENGKKQNGTGQKIWLSQLGTDTLSQRSRTRTHAERNQAHHV